MFVGVFYNDIVRSDFVCVVNNCSKKAQDYKKSNKIFNIHNIFFNGKDWCITCMPNWIDVCTAGKLVVICTQIGENGLVEYI